jgi:hypothetical protein
MNWSWAHLELVAPSLSSARAAGTAAMFGKMLGEKNSMIWGFRTWDSLIP